MSLKPPALHRFGWRYLLPPLLLGGGLIAYLWQWQLAQNGMALADLWAKLPKDRAVLGWLGLALLMDWLRDFAYIWQLRILTDRRLPWLACCQILLIWNFSAAVSPSMVGGAPLALFMLTREGLSLGRATAIVFTTVFLDQAFYLAIPPMATLLVDHAAIVAPLTALGSELVGGGLIAAFWSAFGSMAAYVAFLVFALFIAPGWVNRRLKHLLRWRRLKPLRRRGWRMLDDLKTASRNLRTRPQRFWWQLWAVTSLAWIGRYLVLNCVLQAFAGHPMGWHEHVLAFARQAGLYVLMVVSPTPGGAGMAEMAFAWLFSDFIPPGLELTLAMIWRGIGYYPYLIIGIPMMTWWLKRVRLAGLLEKH